MSYKEKPDGNTYGTNEPIEPQDKSATLKAVEDEVKQLEKEYNTAVDRQFATLTKQNEHRGKELAKLVDTVDEYYNWIDYFTPKIARVATRLHRHRQAIRRLFALLAAKDYGWDLTIEQLADVKKQRDKAVEALETITLPYDHRLDYPSTGLIAAKEYRRLASCALTEIAKLAPSVNSGLGGGK